MATVPVLRTWVAGEFPTAAEMNANIRDALNFLLGIGTNVRPRMAAGLSASDPVQTIPSGGSVQPVSLTATEDTDSGWNGVTYTVGTAGCYDISAECTYVPMSGTGIAYGGIYKDGQEQCGGTTTFSSDQTGRIAFAITGLRLVVGDTITLQTLQTSGMARALNRTPPNSSVSNPFMTIEWRSA